MSVSRYALKKKITKTFDTKLFLFGSGSLLVLLILGLFFTGSLFRRSADSMLAAANLAYEKALYAQAVSGYEMFITKFPNHSGASTAKIRRALARVRFAVDEQSDYINAYNIAAGEIAAVENEPEFFEVSKAELSVLLPKIATGSADEAQAKTSLFAAERAELTLALLDKLFPNSLHPVEQIAAVKAKVKAVRRTIVRQNALKEAEEKLNELQNASPFDGMQLEKCYAVFNSLLSEYPEIAAQQEFRNLMRTAAEKESQAVIPAAVQLTALNTDTGLSSPDAAEPSAEVLAVLVKQNTSVKTENGKNPLIRPFYHPFYYDENIYGIDLSSGSLMWKQPLKNFVPPGMKPKILPYFSSRSITESGFILVNTETGTFRQYERMFGKLRTEFSLKKKSLKDFSLKGNVFVSDIVQNDTECLFAAATESGILTLLKVDSDSAKPVSCIAAYQLPQKVDSPPFIDLQSRTIFQFAESQTLFRIPLQENQKIISLYTGHPQRTIRTAPQIFNSFCLFVRQTSENTCELVVFSLEEEMKERYLQTFPISGLVDCPVQIDGGCCAVISDMGEISLFEKSSNPAEPLQLLGRGSAGGSAAVSFDAGISRSAVLNGNSIWTAGRQLMLFALQPAQKRLLPVKMLRTGIKTEMPLFVNPYNKKQLIHCFTEPEWGGLQIAADDITADKTSEYKNVWRTELAAPIIQEPQLTIKNEKKYLTVYTSDGKSWEIPLDAEILDAEKQRITAPQLEVPAGTFGSVSTSLESVRVPLGRVIPLQDGYSAWVGTSGNFISSIVKIFDPSAKENKFPSVSLPAPPAAMPVNLDSYLLVPLQNNTIALYDVKQCTPAAVFKPLRHLGRDALWGNPLVMPDSKSFIITDSRTEEEGKGLYNLPFLYKIELENEDGKLSLVEEKDAVSEKPADGQFPPVPGFVPAGLPFFTENSVLLNSADGIVKQFSRKDSRLECSIETGLKLSAGAVMFDNIIYLSGIDGTVYKLENKQIENIDKK